MEQLNKVQLRGYVGRAQTQPIGDSALCRFSVATNYAYTDKSGSQIVDTTWHYCIAWKSETMPDFSGIVKGAAIELEGRIRNVKYTGNDGVERSSTEIVVNSFQILAPPRQNW